MAVSARDKKTLLTLLEQAQLVYLLTRLPKKQVLDDEKDVARLEEGLAAMRAAAGDLSPALRRQHAGVQWDELAEKPDSPDLLWRRAKRVGPQVLRELRPLLEGEPEAPLGAGQMRGGVPATSGRLAHPRSGQGSRRRAHAPPRLWSGIASVS